MYAYVAALFVGVVGLVKLLAVLIKRSRSSLASVPGPWYSKYTPAVLVYKALTGQRTEYIEALHRKYGKVVRLSPREVDFSSTNGAKRILSYRSPFVKSEMYDGVRRNFKAPSAFSTRDVVYHAQRRRILSGPLSESGLKSVENVVEGRAELAVHRIGEEMKKRGAADLYKWWLFMTTDVIGELAFGDSFRMLEQGRKNQYSNDLDKAAMMASQRDGIPTLLKLSYYLPFLFPAFGQVGPAMKRMFLYAEESISRYEKMLAANPFNPKPTLFTKLFQAGEEGLSHEEIVAQASSYILAGTDTTANTLTYLVWSVCRHEDVKQRLVKEVGRLEEGYKDDVLKELPYLSHVIKETLRLYPAVPAGLPRDIPPGGCEVDGWWMPGGTIVCTQAYSMHRDPVTFPDPERFNPSRWEHPTQDMKDRWMPFGGGARICLGLHLAYMELRYAAAKFFRAYPNAKVSKLEGFTDDEMQMSIYFLMYPKGKRCLIQGS